MTMRQHRAEAVAKLGPAPTTPAEALAHVVKVYADSADEALVIMATSNVYGDGVRTGLTMGDLRALNARVNS